ncbi:hypothetical protein HYDPIDRAFT_42037 [Hydnomerulius pinastri MD-312]|uniref:Uncharacterized protein n=1 Tax=Hydnomerulius pinastri MD-312 TaxID=994086 RepID=A0A0C9VVU8_9AGAM|nr:hypothetical protein HYDPIDRAFT_42037 [Hydnomerulius pinastri MD-312]
MLFSKAFTVICLAHIAAAFPFDFALRRKRDVDPTLVPSFGWVAGINPDGTGNCDGAVNGTDGKPILIPCQCPPNSTFFLDNLNKNVAAGFVTTNPTVKLTFPTDNSTASQSARLNAAAVTLQNLEGPGVGCPISSTTFSAQQKAIDAESTNPTPSASPSVVPTVAVANDTPGGSTPVTTAGASCPTPVTVTQTVTAPAGSPSSTTSSPPLANTAAATPSGGTGNVTTPTDAQIAALAPPLGWQSGINPDGTGNCDGAVNGSNGKPALIPCQCPPDQTNYIANLTANIRAGHVVLNPTVLLSFPTDNSTASQNARLNAAAVTIQNLNGVGKGCPIVSTTFSAQQKAIDAEGSS